MVLEWAILVFNHLSTEKGLNSKEREGTNIVRYWKVALYKNGALDIFE